MKRCLQFVALSMAILLAAPPALARELCLDVQGAQGMAGDDCCAGASHAASRLTDLKGSTPLAQANNGCGKGCCSVSSPSAPSQTVPGRVKMDVAQPAALAKSDASQLPTYAAKPSSRAFGRESAPDLFLLHKMFRI
jgi:hypothetical protein